MRRTPLTPIFDYKYRKGAVTAEGTIVPGSPYFYDDVIATMGLMWYCKGDRKPVPAWPTLAEALAQDVAAENVRGRIYFEAWYLESGYAPANYEAAIPNINLLWYSTVDVSSAVTWPLWSTVIAGDYAAENQKGRAWFAAWFNESGYAPANYDTAISDAGYLGTDLMWFSKVASSGAVTWPTLAVVMAGDYADESQKGRFWFSAWYTESGQAPGTYRLNLDETGPMWYVSLGDGWTIVATASTPTAETGSALPITPV